MEIFITPKIITQKCRYALRAIFELANRQSAQPVKISDIASSQDISPRFLENILLELKHGGFVASKRGNDGGYFLSQRPENLTVGQIIAFVQGTAKNDVLEPTPQISCRNGDYAFSHLWQRLNDSIASVYNQVTFADLVNEEAMAVKSYVPNYVI
ncbi:MAG: HTH-type transcriptional regulator CymR [Planctomycetes bacterium ADurb.Bin401]|nr:MAG: HTH-type transcriptional regulator CymR [Planctomycetes bacterium ADurb.Bin401]